MELRNQHHQLPSYISMIRISHTFQVPWERRSRVPWCGASFRVTSSAHQLNTSLSDFWPVWPRWPFPPDTPAIPSRASQLPLTSPSGTDTLLTAWILMGLPWVMGRIFLSVCSLSSQFLSLLTPNSLGTPHIGIAETFRDFLLPCRLHSISTKHSFN